MVGFEYEDDKIKSIFIEGDCRLSMVGCFLIEHNVKYEIMADTLSKLWQPVRGIFTKTLYDNLFLFWLFYEFDLNRFLEGSPWTFNR